MYLYKTILEKSIPDDPAPLNSDEKTALVKTIKNLDYDGHEKIYAIIKYYHVLDRESDNFVYPYCMKKTPLAGIRVDLECLPVKLQYILIEFIKLHQQILVK